MRQGRLLGCVALVLGCSGGGAAPEAGAPEGAVEAPAASMGAEPGVDPGQDIDGSPVPTPESGVAPITIAVPPGLFKEVEVRCAGGFVEQGAPEEAGAKAVIMVHGLPEGESCVVFMKGDIVSRFAPVTGGQRWSCKFRKAEPMCKLLGGPEGPSIPTGEDWPWDKVENRAVSKKEALEFDRQHEGAAAAPEAQAE